MNLKDMTEGPACNAETAELLSIATATLELIDDRLSTIVKMRFGIGMPPTTLQVIGDTYGFSRERARQLISKGIQQMREKMGLLEP